MADIRTPNMNLVILSGRLVQDPEIKLLLREKQYPGLELLLQGLIETLLPEIGKKIPFL